MHVILARQWRFAVAINSAWLALKLGGGFLQGKRRRYHQRSRLEALGPAAGVYGKIGRCAVREVPQRGLDERAKRA